MLTPLPASKWNYTTAAHLLNRAGFGGTPAEVDKLAAMDPDGAVAYFVDYEKISDSTPDPAWAKPDPERMERLQEMRKAAPEKRKELQREQQRKQREQITELRQWWLERMAHGPRPLQEKLTLFWHGHFATSAQKVKDAYFMWLQNDTFRRHASGNWLEMLTAVSKDPAMLFWLDQAQSRRQHPNENFAREVMELFTLGEGHYTEKDITEAARALTGWSIDRVNERFVNRPALHDDGSKTFLGKTGRLTGEDVLETIVQQHQASKFIVAKLWSFFAAENPPEPLVEALASEFEAGGRKFKPVLAKMFRSEEFYAGNVVRQQVKSPVQWLVGSVKMLERDLPPLIVSANTLRVLGQDLLLPPNVKGWDGGLSWITTSNLLNRYNYAAFLVTGENPMGLMAQGAKGPKGNKPRPRLGRGPFGRGRPIDIDRIVPEAARQDKDSLIAALEKRFLQSTLREKQRKTLAEFIESQGKLDREDLLHTVRLVMSTPEFQLI